MTDIEKLKKDLVDYYGTAAFSGYPLAVMDVARIEAASTEDLLREADKNGLDLSKYTKFISEDY